MKSLVHSSFATIGSWTSDPAEEGTLCSSRTFCTSAKSKRSFSPLGKAGCLVPSIAEGEVIEGARL